ncbi:MAG TPA: phospholipase, partial [Chloroflexota bacterium]|nr:phospholipase [Chloroflexota bacterium]
LRVIALRAPVTLAAGSYAWVDLAVTPQGFTYDQRVAVQCLMRITAFIDAIARPYTGQPVYLLGFSQGADFAVSAALHRSDLIAGAVLVAGSIPPEARLLAAGPERLARLAILLAHGTVDQLVPVSFARTGRAMLTSLGAGLTYREYLMGHEISPDCLADIHAWLAARLDEHSAP